MLALQVLARIDSKLKTMSEKDIADYFPAAMDFTLADGKHWAFPWYYNA